VLYKDYYVNFSDKSYKNKELLKNLYIKEKKSPSKIAKILGCSETTIINWLKKFCIQIRNNSESKRGQNNHRWKGGETVDKSGYVLVRSVNHPQANKNGYVRRSRLFLERKLGRYLRPEEIVHHKNGDIKDDRPINLKLFSCRSEHFSFHWEGWRI
jgi:hypothetical protein